MKKDAGAERGIPTVRTTKTVRFASVVATAGKPEVYLPLFDPKQDRAFMRAVKEHRVLSLRQEPTSKHTDFGVVGFDERHKHTTLLVFPKPLTKFLDARIVGIKYDVVGESRVAASAAPRGLKIAKPPVAKPSRPAAPAKRAELRREPEKRPETKRLEPPKRVEPQPKEYRVRLRITSVTEKDVTVKAMNKAEAKKAAEHSEESEGNVRAVSVSEL